MLTWKNLAACAFASASTKVTSSLTTRASMATASTSLPVSKALQNPTEFVSPARCMKRSKGEIGDVFALQDQVTARVVSAIAPRLQQAEIERARRKPTGSLDAYDLYLRGLANFYKFTREGFEEALRLYCKAIELDADFGTACAATAFCIAQRKALGLVIDREGVAEAKRLALRAVQLGKDDATVLSSAGYVLAYVVRDLDDGAAFLDRALLINPNFAPGWTSNGWVKLWLGEPDRAIEQFAQAMRLSPTDPTLCGMQIGTAHAHFFAGRYDDAVIWAKMALREVPDYHAALRVAAAGCALAGRDEEAKRMVARLLEIILHCEFPTSRMYWAPTVNQYTRQSMQMLCERRAYLNDGRLKWPVRSKCCSQNSCLSTLGIEERLGNQ